MTTIFNKEITDFKNQPMFFGESLNTQRFDTFKYPVLDKLNKQMISFFWVPEEFDLNKDRNDYHDFRPEQKHIFTANLKYQTLLDSVQARGPSLAFLPYCSLGELEGCLLTWSFFESIHSRSYTHIIKNVYPRPEEVLDKILDDENIIKRAITVTKEYDLFIEMAQEHFVVKSKKYTLRQVKKQLYLAMMNVNILEGLRFYVSFACTFAFGELKMMPGAAKIISLIARDESQHLALSTHILKNWQSGKDDPDMPEIIAECDDIVYDMWKTVVDEEKEWAKYLFKDGSIIGLNEILLGNYVEHIANRRLKALGYDPIFETSALYNPLPWTQHWLNSKEVQIAPQEQQLESYLIGAINKDVKDDQFEGFSL